MDNDNVIPFRKRPPSEREMDVYRQITRCWSDASKQLLLPDHYQLDLGKRAETSETD
jgi:hypothetical protein